VKARQARQHVPLMPWALVHEQLKPWLANTIHAPTELSRRTGVNHATCSRYLLGRREMITVPLAQRLLTAIQAQDATLPPAQPI
jgi:hypothetical protein